MNSSFQPFSFCDLGHDSRLLTICLFIKHVIEPQDNIIIPIDNSSVYERDVWGYMTPI